MNAKSRAMLCMLPSGTKGQIQAAPAKAVIRAWANLSIDSMSSHEQSLRCLSVMMLGHMLRAKALLVATPERHVAGVCARLLFSWDCRLHVRFAGRGDLEYQCRTSRISKAEPQAIAGMPTASCLANAHIVHCTRHAARWRMPRASSVCQRSQCKGILQRGQAAVAAARA